MRSHAGSVNETSRVLRGFELSALEKARPANDPTGKRSLRIAIVSENFLPKIDGVTRTLAKLLEHLQSEGHQALVLGPNSGMDSYAGHEVVGTRGLPMLGVYKGLALNFIRPKFLSKLRQFQPDVIHFVDPIWLCAQVIPVVQWYMPDIPLVASYHTNLASYATLFGAPWLTPTMWKLMASLRNLHSRCQFTACPSPSTQRMLESQGFSNVIQWPRGVYTTMFHPGARNHSLRQAWGAEPNSNVNDDSQLSQADNDFKMTGLTSSTEKVKVSKVVMLYVGRISWEKNLRLLVEAFRGLEKPSQDGSRPACKLVFVGDGPARSELEQRCRAYGLDAVFMGYRKGHELAACFASADIFAFPSWTETFGQVVLESLASGLPVVGLRAEGVSDLVRHGETGLLLDMDDLVPTTSAATHSSSETTPPEYSTLKPLPANPHALVGQNAPTFPVAVSMYRSLLIELASDHDRRKRMGHAAAVEASSKSWHGAMEMLVDGYRNVVARHEKRLSCVDENKKPLELSRQSTVEVDIVCDTPDDNEFCQGDKGGPSARVSSTDPKRRRLLRFGTAFRRTGRIKHDSKAGSMSLPPLRSWLGRNSANLTMSTAESTSTNDILVVEKGEQAGQLWALKWLLQLIILSYLLYLASTRVVHLDPIARLIQLI
ncbi:hypothetical protein OIO90_004509 [Microbotryomycetes sp. JL221]|nr:hypothetical protein OIO90_004509 [Microbotryomycetes sp. JL221]